MKPAQVFDRAAKRATALLLAILFAGSYGLWLPSHVAAEHHDDPYGFVPAAHSHTHTHPETHHHASPSEECLNGNSSSSHSHTCVKIITVECNKSYVPVVLHKKRFNLRTLAISQHSPPRSDAEPAHPREHSQASPRAPPFTAF